jgi:integrase
MPRLIVPRGGRFGAQVPKQRGRGYRWLGTFDTQAEAEAAVCRAREPRGGRSRGTRDVKPPSETLLLALAAAAPEWLRDMILVAAFSGMRLFEVAALQPEDLLEPVDGAGWRIRVRRGKGGYTGELCVIFEPGLEVVRRRAAATPAERLIFTTAIGTPITRQHVARHFSPAAESVGFTTGGFHSTRHFHACWLIDRGASDLDVAAQLRHHDNGEEVRRRYGRYRATSAALRRIEALA